MTDEGTRAGAPGASGPYGGREGRAFWFGGHDVAKSPADAGADLVNVGFLAESLRRNKRWWVGLAVMGMLFGMFFWASRPPAPQASTSLLLDVGPEGQPGTAILNEQVVAQSRGVAGLALKSLGLHQTIASLQSTYTARPVTDRILLITATAPTSGEAVSRANAIAAAFLAFRAHQLQQQLSDQVDSLNALVRKSQADLVATDARIAQLGNPTSASQRTELTQLRAQRAQQAAALNTLKPQVSLATSDAENTESDMVSQSKVLDKASPVAQSRFKPLVLFTAAGMIFGLCLGAGIVILRAIVSDRLRRRDDVAAALDAPVKLSIPATPLIRRRPGARGLAATQRRDIRRIVAFLRGTVSTGSQRAALAVVPVDSTRVASLSVVSLAEALAKQKARVVVADLCGGAPAAKLVGVKEPGVHEVHVNGARIQVVVPDPDDFAPVGPLSRDAGSASPDASREVADAWACADVLLTLTTLDPSLASDHLGTWAADAVVVVRAGRSSWTKIHAVGELIRLAGTRLVSAVLVDADRADESLGVAGAVSRSRHASTAMIPDESTTATSLTTTSAWFASGEASFDDREADVDEQGPRQPQSEQKPQQPSHRQGPPAQQQRDQPRRRSRSERRRAGNVKAGDGRPEDKGGGTGEGRTA